MRPGAFSLSSRRSFRMPRTGCRRGGISLAAAAAGLVLAPDLALGQVCPSGDVGTGFAAGPDLSGRNDDRGAVCDEFINPLFADVPGCTDPCGGATVG